MNKRIKKKKAKQQAQINDLKSWNQAVINVTDTMIPVVKSIENARKAIIKIISEVDWYQMYKEYIENHSDHNN